VTSFPRARGANLRRVKYMRFDLLRGARSHRRRERFVAGRTSRHAHRANNALVGGMRALRVSRLRKIFSGGSKFQTTPRVYEIYVRSPLLRSFPRFIRGSGRVISNETLPFSGVHYAVN